MKAIDMLAALGLPETKYNKTHCSRLANVYSFLKDNRIYISKAEILDDNHPFWFGRETRNCGSKEIIVNEGEKCPASLIKVTTWTGEYKFAIPQANPFYYAVCDLLGLAYETPAADKGTPLQAIQAPAALLKAFGRAAKFVSRDDLRPSLMRVCLILENNTIEIAATNCHWLYQSQKMTCDYKGNRLEILIDKADAAKIARKKKSGKTIPINIYPGGRLSIDGVECVAFDGKFPDYRVVVPEYANYLTVDREGLITAIEQVLPSANKSTKMVKFHINGCIQLNTEDVDFGLECQKEIDYLEKRIPDTDIGLNGKFMLQTLANFKEKQVKIYTDGKSEKPVVISNDVESILLMPMVLNA